MLLKHSALDVFPFLVFKFNTKILNACRKNRALNNPYPAQADISLALTVHFTICSMKEDLRMLWIDFFVKCNKIVSTVRLYTQRLFSDKRLL